MNASTAWHEAAHTAACIWLRRPVEHVWVTPGLAFPGEEIGHCRAPVPRTDGIQARDLAVSLVGYWAEGEPGWPPTYAEAREEKLEAIATLIRVLRLKRSQYEALVDETREMLEHPEFKRLQGAIARALVRVPRLEAEDVEALCRAHGFPIPRQQEHRT
jgi:hypothetical protein